MSGNKNATVAPEIAVDNARVVSRSAHHIFQGALPLAHMSLRTCISR
jgi:hypothetical protein